METRCFEQVVRVGGGWMSVRHGSIDPGRPSLLLIHGLGASGLSFLEAFERPELRGYNIIAPDLLGYGRSVVASGADLGFDAHIQRLWEIVEYFGMPEVTLVGHSMGGDLVTLMCAGSPDQRIRGCVNVEGNLTSADLFLSQCAVEADEAGCFEAWLDTFREEKIYAHYGRQWPSCRRYYASLCFARPEAIRINAHEMVDHGRTQGDSSCCHIGERWVSVALPKIYCWGSASLSAGSRAFLSQHRLAQRRFDGAFHWIMVDQSDAFYRFLADWSNPT